MRRCKDCFNFRPAVNLEVAQEIDFRSKNLRGTCDINNNRRNAADECGCGEFRRI